MGGERVTNADPGGQPPTVLGDPTDPPAGDDSDVRRSSILLTAAGLLAAALAVVAIAALH